MRHYMNAVDRLIQVLPMQVMAVDVRGGDFLQDHFRTTQIDENVHASASIVELSDCCGNVHVYNCRTIVTILRPTIAS